MISVINVPTWALIAIAAAMVACSLRSQTRIEAIASQIDSYVSQEQLKHGTQSAA